MTGEAQGERGRNGNVVKVSFRERHGRGNEATCHRHIMGPVDIFNKRQSNGGKNVFNPPWFSHAFSRKSSGMVIAPNPLAGKEPSMMDRHPSCSILSESDVSPALT